MSANTILIVDDDQPMRDALAATLGDTGYRCVSAGGAAEALEVLSSEPISLLLTDMQMDGPSGADLMQMARSQRPDLPVILMSAYGTIDEAVGLMLDGAANYLVKPFDIDMLSQRIDALLPDNHSGPIADDPAMVKVLQTARLVANSDVTVTINGESGTGKEVIAREIHRCSSRADKPLVAINCAAIPDQMLEAILFGHKKGAFTGATEDCVGKFEQAQHSTLLLDEVTEMDLGLQAKLLRVLQEREVERLGSSEPISLDVRVIATTNRDLVEAVANGEFREDLYYRLNVFPLTVPALRDRPLDIPPLAQVLLQRHAPTGSTVTIDDAAIESLCRYPWPGNVRELENQMQRALVLANGAPITSEHLQLAPPSLSIPEVDNDDLQSALLDQESRTIIAALDAVKGNRGAAAQRLGISPRTLRYKLAKLRKAGVYVGGRKIQEVAS